MVDMSLNIKNERTHALVRELATLTGVSQTEAVEEAVKARLAELSAEKEQQARFERIMAISRETGMIIRETGGPLDFEDLYDEMGLPK
jgi:antitoxin VapB